MKIFLCSTSHDLEDLRALAVNRFGDKYEFIHFEDAAFSSRRGLHSHDQCIEAIKQADVVVCIIDRRYGGRYSGSRAMDFPELSFEINGFVDGKKQKVPVVIPTTDLSITWCELIAAFRDEKYVITFARRRTMDEKATRRKNQGVSNFKPAHADDVRIFDLLDWITKRQKDNWIIPFNNAVDFLNNMEKWLSIANKNLVLPTLPEAHGRKPVIVIVEGENDAEIVRAIAETIALNRPLMFVVAEGKRSLLGNLKGYVKAFKNSAGIVILADADTVDIGKIEIQKAQFQQIIEESERPDTHLILVVPVIATWLGISESTRDRIHFHEHFYEEVSKFQNTLSQRTRLVPSLAEFIDVLKSIEMQP